MCSPKFIMIPYNNNNNIYLFIYLATLFKDPSHRAAVRRTFIVKQFGILIFIVHEIHKMVNCIFSENLTPVVVEYTTFIYNMLKRKVYVNGSKDRLVWVCGLGQEFPVGCSRTRDFEFYSHKMRTVNKKIFR